MGEGGGGEEKGRKGRERFLSFTSLPFSLPFFPFSPETPDTQAMRGRDDFVLRRIILRLKLTNLAFLME